MITAQAPTTSADVFLSYSAHDEELAAEVTQKFTAAGLSVFGVSGRDVEEAGATGPQLGEAMREAMLESTALVAVVTPADRDSPALAVEVGGAWMRGKPIYVLVDKPRSAELPLYLRRFHVVSLSRLPQVIRTIAKEARPLPEDQQQALANAYEQAGVPLERLLTDNAALEGLSRAFNRATDRDCSGERLVRELLRLRKQGRLPDLE